MFVWVALGSVQFAQLKSKRYLIVTVIAIAVCLVPTVAV